MQRKILIETKSHVRAWGAQHPLTFASLTLAAGLTLGFLIGHI